MKKIFAFVLIINSFIGFAQTEKLYYFIKNDSLVGIKNQNGKVIIPASYNLFPSADGRIQKEEIKEKTINFWSIAEGPKVYDRKGNFLYKPYMFDAGFDDYNEEYVRFTEDKKIGFADLNGNKVIPAKYDWVSTMNFGFAQYCLGCYFDRSKDDEHPPLVGGTWGYVDKKGLEIVPNEHRNHPKDFETENHQFIPYQFQYNDKEKQILDFFEKRKDQISKIYGLDCKKNDLYFEIIEKPTESQPYYKIKTFELCDQYLHGANENYDDYKIFKVSENGKEFFAIYIDLVDHKEYSEYVERKISVEKWIKKNLKMKK